MGLAVGGSQRGTPPAKRPSPKPTARDESGSFADLALNGHNQKGSGLLPRLEAAFGVEAIEVMGRALVYTYRRFQHWTLAPKLLLDKCDRVKLYQKHDVPTKGGS